MRRPLRLLGACLFARFQKLFSKVFLQISNSTTFQFPLNFYLFRNLSLLAHFSHIWETLCFGLFCLALFVCFQCSKEGSDCVYKKKRGTEKKEYSLGNSAYYTFSNCCSESSACTSVLVAGSSERSSRSDLIMLKCFYSNYFLCRLSLCPFSISCVCVFVCCSNRVLSIFHIARLFNFLDSLSLSLTE